MQRGLSILICAIYIRSKLEQHFYSARIAPHGGSVKQLGRT
jgi:hypothetical protein